MVTVNRFNPSTSRRKPHFHRPKIRVSSRGMNSLWRRFQRYFLRYNHIGFTIHHSRMLFADDFLQSMGARAQRAFSEMRQLEAGAIANVDEHRMVGHYWLRNPGLAPSASLRNDIEETVARIKKFAAEIHAGGIAPATGKF